MWAHAPVRICPLIAVGAKNLVLRVIGVFYCTLEHAHSLTVLAPIFTTVVVLVGELKNTLVNLATTYT